MRPRINAALKKISIYIVNEKYGMYDIGLFAILNIPSPHKCMTPQSLIALHLCLTFIACSNSQSIYLPSSPHNVNTL